MKIIFLPLASLLCAVFVLASCAKPRGCTDPVAFTYDAEAEKDNGTCMYQRSYWDNHAQGGWIDLWVAESDTPGSPLIYEGRIIDFQSETPDCDDRALLWTARRPGEYYYETENDQGNILFGWVPYREEPCRLYELEYE